MRKAQFEFQLETTLASYGPQSPSRSHRLVRSLQKSASRGAAASQYELARRYEESDGIDRDRASARVWLLMASRNGHVPSMVRLGKGLLEADGFETNRCQGLYWLLKAANRGSSEACAFLGQARLNGHELPQSDELALAWYRKGANRGCLTSMLGLAFCFMRGRGVERCPVKAHVCLSVAAARCADVPLLKMERQEQLTSDQIDEVESLKIRVLDTGRFDF